MNDWIGIKKEVKNQWERRTPLVPKHVEKLGMDRDLKCVVEPSELRAFPNGDYRQAGCLIKNNLSPTSVVFAIKEIPIESILEGKTYCFFSHTIKGQSHNMPMLKDLMEKRCSLIDYEMVKDENGNRLLKFGHYAGLAGMVDVFWALGQRWKLEGYSTPLEEVKRAFEYSSVRQAKSRLEILGERIQEGALPEDVSPLVVGLAGYGDVSSGAQEIIEVLPFEDLTPNDLLATREDRLDNSKIYRCVFREEDMVVPRNPEKDFQLQDYYENPERYKSQFEKFLPRLTVLINAIYWEEQYPRLVSKENVLNLFHSQQSPKLKIIGDISCDIEGAIEVTTRSTNPGDPVFVYEVNRKEAQMGLRGDGPVVLAVDNLPGEFPRASSAAFSQALLSYVEPIAKANYSRNVENLSLPAEIKKALIVHKGKLTPSYRYLLDYL